MPGTLRRLNTIEDIVAVPGIFLGFENKPYKQGLNFV
jgi:hypothetical protein